MENPEQLLAAPLVSVIGFSDAWTRWLEAADVGVAETPGWAKTDNSLTALEMARSGYGVALVPHLYAAEYVRNGDLIVPFDISISASGNHYLVTPRKLYQRDELYREFVDYVVASAEEKETTDFRIGIKETL